ncbi:MAG: hypothetical protein IKP88_10520 [Lachnospiraceae bacterium]|nr:hypothetical protein [Lachnospiraceae bacterium]
MNKTTAIILLVLLAVLLIGVFKILLPSIKLYIARMPKGIFVLLFLVIIGAIVYLVYFLINDRTGGISGNESTEHVRTAAEQEELEIKKENCVVLRGDEVWVENEQADSKTLDKYLDYRVENNITVTIVDDYSTVALFREIKAICEKKGVRISIEDEKWLE